MANETEGGVVTTVKEETTKDLDVLARLAELNDETPAAEAKPKDTPKAEVNKEEPKPKAEIKQPKLDDDDDYIPLDFNSLDPKQQAAVRRVYQQRRKASQRADFLEEELQRVRQQTKREEPKEKETVRVDLSSLGERPKPPDPKTWKGTQEEYDKKYEEYEDARDEWNYKRRRAEEKAEDQRTAQEKRTQEVIEKFETDKTAFIEAHPDYDEVVGTDEPSTGTMFGFIMEEGGPEVLYYFGQHLPEWRAIYKMGDTDKAVKALLRVKHRLEFEKEAAEKAAKAAADQDKDKDKGKNPPLKEKPEVPATPVGGRTAAPAAKPGPNSSFKEREKAIHRRNPGAFNYEP